MTTYSDGYDSLGNFVKQRPAARPLTAADIQNGGLALNPATGRLEPVYAKFGKQPIEVRQVWDENANVMREVPIYDENKQDDHYDFSFDPTGRQSLGGWAPGYYTDNGAGGLKSLFTEGLPFLAMAGAGALAAPAMGAAAGGGVLGGAASGATMGAASAGGLATADGGTLADVLRAAGTGALVGGATGAFGGMSADPYANVGGVEGLGGAGSTGVDALAGTDVLGGVEGVGGPPSAQTFSASPTPAEVLQIYRDAGVPNGIVGQGEAEYWANSGYSRDAIRQQIEAGYGDYVRGLDFGGQGVPPVAQSFSVSQPTTLDQLLAQAPNIATDVTAPVLGAQMPAAVPAADPTFGGALSQTGPGQFENVNNIISFGTPGASMPSGTPPGVGIQAPPVVQQPQAPLPDAGMDLGALTDPNPYTSGVTQTDLTNAGGQGAAANATSGAGGVVPTVAAGAAATGAGLGSRSLRDILNGNVGLGDLTLGDLGPLLGAGLGAYGANELGNSMAEIASAQRQADQARYEDLVRREDARYTDLRGREDQAIARQRGDIEFGRGVGAPSRQRYEDSFSSNFNVGNLPGLQQAMDTSYQSMLRGLSAQGGNPFGNPGGLAEAMNYVTGNVVLPELNRYRSLNAQTGGYGSYAGSGAAVPGTNSSLPGSVSTMSNTANALGPAMQSAKADSGVYDALGYGLGNLTNPPTDFTKLIRSLGGGNNRYASLV